MTPDEKQRAIVALLRNLIGTLEEQNRCMREEIARLRDELAKERESR